MPLKLTLSFLLVAAVLWSMWRLSARGEVYAAWAPLLALLSAWGGLIALGCSVFLWLVPWPDPLIAVVLLALDPASIATGTLVLWIYRRDQLTQKTVQQQILQAKVGIVLGLFAVAAGYLFIFIHKPIGSIVGT